MSDPSWFDQMKEKATTAAEEDRHIQNQNTFARLAAEARAKLDPYVFNKIAPLGAMPSPKWEIKGNVVDIDLSPLLHSLSDERLLRLHTEIETEIGARVAKKLNSEI